MLGRLFSALLVSSLVLSTPLLWSQTTQPVEEIPTAEEISARFLDRTIPSWPFPEARTHPGFAQQGPPVSLEAIKSQTGLRVRSFAPCAGAYRYFNSQIPSNPMQLSGAVESLGNSKDFTTISGQWLKPVVGTHHPTM